MGNNIDKITDRLLDEHRKASGKTPFNEKGAIYEGLRAAGASIGLGVMNPSGLVKLALEAGSVEQGKDIKNNDESPGDSSSVSKTRSDRW